MHERYFAYGSNLWLEQMTARTGLVPDTAAEPQIARLPGHRLVFNVPGDGGEVFANIKAPGEGVLGVVYVMSRETLARLDAYEGGYARRELVVVTQSGEELPVTAYVAEPVRLIDVCRPNWEYLQRIVRGARQHGLPEAYIREIEMLAAMQGE